MEDACSVGYYIVETVPVDKKGIPLRPSVNGGMIKRECPDQKPVNYVAVESVDEYSDKIKTLGGTIIVPKQAAPSRGWLALALDPEGNSFGIFKSTWTQG